MTNCKYKLRKLSVGLVSVGTMLIAPTVLGQEVNASTETSTSSTSTTSTASAVETSTTTGTSGTAASVTGNEATVANATTTNGGTQSVTATSEATPQPQAQKAPATTSTSSASSSNEKSTTAATSSTPSTSSSSEANSDAKSNKVAATPPSATVASPSNGSNQGTGTEVEPQMMDVEQYKVNKEKTELKVKDGKETNGSGVNKKLIRNRDGEQRDIFDIKREVKTNSDGTIDVTVTVTPKEIDKGADVMALLDVSQKMTEEDFKNAKDKIKKLVKTLTEKNGKNHNSRNSVRLMTFYREISKPIDISGKTEEQLEKLLNELREEAKANYDWGVDLQGAIHKARTVFKNENNDNKKKSGKRQHIVLFSQGESTFSYELQDSVKKDTSKLSRLTETVTSSNPLLPWPPIFDHTHKNGDILNDVRHLISFADRLGIKSLSWLKAPLDAISIGNGLFGSVLGGPGLGEYLTLKEYNSRKLNEDQFDYTKRVGEGYHYHSFSNRNSEDNMPLESELKKVLETYLPKFKEENWFTSVLQYFGLKEKAEQTKLDVIMKVIKSVFYKRQYHYYNHNLSAIAEAKMAQEEGITFYSVDVTDFSSASKRAKRQVESEKSTKKEKDKEDIERKRNEKFDRYLKEMSEGQNFLNDTDVKNQDKFKDTLTEVKVTETFENSVSVENQSWKVSSTSNHKENVKYTNAKEKSWFSSEVKESLTWTISKEQLKEAFEKNSSLTFKYKLRVNKDKLLDKDKKRTKRDTPTEDKTSVTAKIISNTTTYKINGQEVKDNKLDDVSLTYSKFKVPVPQIDGHVIEPQAPTLPKLPPVTERGPVLDYTEESIYRLPLEHGSNAPDTQVTIEEDTVPQRPDILVGGQSGPVDITEDTQPGMSGSNDATVVEEDTAPKRPDVLVGGQSGPIDITEDTQPSVSGSNDATVVEEDTVPQRPDILVGGQSDPIDITEDTQPGMSGSNDATVIEEDTKPKRFFHFDNEPQAPEKPKEQPSLSLPQAPVYKAAHHLPASGDKREASFTIAALTIIGAAGLLSKKRRDTEEN
ncbi:serum opacification factor [Streptococcus pyogenes]|uniref:serum opacification factor n=1 Tax=Streptococcus pyogenes TaxID=1314 RepID=UPI0010F2C254|nr:serum opacification factor [Streptococcus pyogenes]VHD47241.1 Serum opacity factor [Streptococcus pyogenes]